MDKDKIDIIEEGGELLYEDISKGIEEIQKKYKTLGEAMKGYWSGELTWDEQVNMVSNWIDKEVINMDLKIKEKEKRKEGIKSFVERKKK
jgi:hypothetical protein